MHAFHVGWASSGWHKKCAGESSSQEGSTTGNYMYPCSTKPSHKVSRTYCNMHNYGISFQIEFILDILSRTPKPLVRWRNKRQYTQTWGRGPIDTFWKWLNGSHWRPELVKLQIWSLHPSVVHCNVKECRNRSAKKWLTTSKRCSYKPSFSFLLLPLLVLLIPFKPPSTNLVTSTHLDFYMNW